MRFAIKPFSPGTARASILLFALIFTTLFSSPIKAVDCSQTNIDLSSQRQVDSFQANYGGGGTCDTVTGYLRIKWSDIVDLSPLSALVSVGGQFQIFQTSLTNLNGLSALTSVGSTGGDVGVSFHIRDNATLTSLNALSALTSVNGNLQISGNAVLTDLDGLSALTSVGGIGSSLAVSGNATLSNLNGLSNLASGSVSWSLSISGNAALTNLDGLSALTSIGGSLSISGNAAFTNLDGLSALTSIGGSLTIILSDTLTNLDGLSALTSVGWFLDIRYNTALTNLDELSALTSVGGYVWVNGNTALTNLDGLSALREAVSVAVTGNMALDDCQGIVMLVDPIDDFEPGPGSAGVPDVTYEVEIWNNLDGCNSVPDLLGQVPLFEINAGLNDAWYNPGTDGQGFFFIVFPEIEQMFMAWFTYDTERPPADVTAFLGEPGHRWLTAQGEYEENVAVLDVYITSGGVFDSPEPETVTEPDGEIMLEFSTCNAGTITYDIPSIDRQGVVPIERIVLDNVPLCYLLDNQPVPDETSESD